MITTHHAPIPSIHSLIHSTHSFIHSPTNSFIHSFTQSLTHKVIHSFIHSPIHPLTHPCIHPSIHAHTHTHTHSFIHILIHSLTHSLIHSFIDVRSWFSSCGWQSVCGGAYYGAPGSPCPINPHSTHRLLLYPPILYSCGSSSSRGAAHYCGCSPPLSLFSVTASPLPLHPTSISRFHMQLPTLFVTHK